MHGSFAYLLGPLGQDKNRIIIVLSVVVLEDVVSVIVATQCGITGNLIFNAGRIRRKIIMYSLRSG